MTCDSKPENETCKKEKSGMKRLVSILVILAMLGGGLAMAEYAEEAWYAEALKE